MMVWMVAAGAYAQDLTLFFPQLQPGGTADFRIGGLAPGEVGYVVRGVSVGDGACPAPLGGVCLDVTGAPQILGSAPADNSGVARVRLPIPAAVRDGTTAAVQAVAPRGPGGVSSVKSRGVVAVVESGPPCPVYADPTVLPGGNGSAGDPFPTVGYALAFRDASCAEILLYPGTYDENVDFGGAEVSVRGLGGRDATVLTSGVAGDLVTFDDGEGPAARLSGVTLACDPTVPWARGMHVVASSPTLADLAITGCDADPGGAAWFEDAGGSLTDSELTDNERSALRLVDSTTRIAGNTFARNTDPNVAAGGGTAIDVEGGAPVIERNRFTANVGPTNSGPYVLWLEESRALVANNLFTDNVGSGVMLVAFDVGTRILNNTLHANGGIGIYLSSSRTAVVDDNILSQQGSFAGYAASSPGLTWRNNDAWPRSYGGELFDPTGLNGNLAVDPRFVGNGDYHLAWGSQCIDAGRNTSADGVTTDLEGTARPRGLGYDLGAFESW